MSSYQYVAEANGGVSNDADFLTWLTKKIVPVAKVKDPGWLKDYRPISILPALSKALENIMKDQIVVFSNVKGLLNRFQSGFRPGHSTTTAILKITEMTSKRKWIVNPLPFLISLRLLTPWILKNSAIK
jgi:Reverse transcriptase (RNA-dependent DNA polymerase)